MKQLLSSEHTLPETFTSYSGNRLRALFLPDNYETKVKEDVCRPTGIVQRITIARKEHLLADDYADALALKVRNSDAAFALSSLINGYRNHLVHKKYIESVRPEAYVQYLARLQGQEVLGVYENITADQMLDNVVGEEFDKRDIFQMMAWALHLAETEMFDELEKIMSTYEHDRDRCSKFYFFGNYSRGVGRIVIENFFSGITGVEIRKSNSTADHKSETLGRIIEDVGHYLAEREVEKFKKTQAEGLRA